MSRAVLAGMVMCVFALVGCSGLAQLTELQSELEAAGYEVTGLTHNTMNGEDRLAVEAVRPNELPTEEDANRIAEIAWTTYPGEIDSLLVLVNGQQMMNASADDLSTQFGERPDDLAARSDESGRTNVTAIVVVVVVALVFAGLMVLLWRRGRRPPPPAAPPAHPQMPSPYQYPPQPPQNP